MLPDKIQPMLAELNPEPHSLPNWCYEVKLDGVRALAFVDGKAKIQGRGRLLADITGKFPELEVKTRTSGVILDGEIVVLNSQGIPDFNLVARRNHQGKDFAIRVLSKQLPALYWVFDILYKDGQSLMPLALEHRKETLADTLIATDNVKPLPFVVGKGKELFEQVCRANLEGVMAKDLRSPYLQKRSPYWQKFKPVRVGEFLACGFTMGNGSREAAFGSIILAEMEDGKLRYVGNVGSGLNSRTLEEWLSKAVKADCPFPTFPDLSGAKLLYWFKPVPVKVEYFERTETKLRFPRIARC